MLCDTLYVSLVNMDCVMNCRVCEDSCCGLRLAVLLINLSRITFLLIFEHSIAGVVAADEILMTSSSESTFFFLHDRVVNWADLTCHTVLVHVQKIPIEANKAIINTIPFYATTLMDHYCHGRRQMAIHNSQSIESLEE